MTTIIKSVKWESANGADVEVTIKVSKSVEEKIVDADGDKISLGNKVEESKIITLKANGKEIISSSQNPTVLGELNYTNDFIEEAKAKGGYAFISCNVTINEEAYNLVIEAIETAESELEEEFEKENKQIADEIKKAKQAKEEKEIADKKEWATKIIEEVKTRKSEILSREEEKIWRRNYNNLHNEGGDGYIPTRTTLEDVEKAKEILA